MARDQEVIWVKRQWKYFCEGGWTGVSVICPSAPDRADPLSQLVLSWEQPHHEISFQQSISSPVVVVTGRNLSNQYKSITQPK
jgi:hypothetical protein